MGTSTLALVNKGCTFELVTNGVSESGGKLSMTFLPLIGSEMGAAELCALFNGEEEFDVMNDNTVMNVYRNYTLCNSVEFIANYSLGTTYHCPECDAVIEDPAATTCWNCNAAFDAPTPVEETGNVWKVVSQIPDINDRMDDAEEAIEDIISVIL